MYLPPGLSMNIPKMILDGLFMQLKKGLEDERWNKKPERDNPASVNPEWATRHERKTGQGGVFNDWLKNYGGVIEQFAGSGLLNGQQRDMLIDMLGKYTQAEPYNPAQRENLKDMNARLGWSRPATEIFGQKAKSSQGLMDALKPDVRFAGNLAGVSKSASRRAEGLTGGGEYDPKIEQKYGFPPSPAEAWRRNMDAGQDAAHGFLGAVNRERSIGAGNGGNPDAVPMPPGVNISGQIAQNQPRVVAGQTPPVDPMELIRRLMSQWQR